MKQVLGLDISTKTGWALLGEGHNLRWGEQWFSKLRGMERLAAFQGWVRTMLDTHAPALVVMEGYGYSNTNTLVPLVEVGTVFRLECYQRGFSVVEVAPTLLKKYATGKGSAKKDEVRLEVFKRWGQQHPSDNAVDAFVLAKIGMALHSATVPENKAQREVVEVLQKQGYCS